MASITLDAGADSNAFRYTAASTWAHARAGTDGTGATTNFVESYDTGSLFENGRYFGYFDASAIPAGSTINSVVVRVPAVANFENTDTIALHVVSHTASGAIDSSDYNNVGSTTWGNVAFSGLSGGSTTDITLNATGIAAFQAATVNKIALITSLDLNNVEPTGGNAYTAGVLDYDVIVDYTAPLDAFEKSYSFFL